VSLLVRFRRWVIIAIAVGALLYLAGSVWAGLTDVQEALGRFRWPYLVPVVALTLLNYGLRFFKWHYLLGRLGVPMPLRVDIWNFAAGLAMVISPGKAGELLKPYVVREHTGVPMARTIPALVTERLTDGIAMLVLAGFGVTTYASDQAHLLAIPGVLIAAGLLVLASERLSFAILSVIARLPVVDRLAPKLREMYIAMRTCVAPWPLVLTVVVSIIAWSAECVGFLLTFQGLGVEADLGVCVFIYAFATTAGAAMPGGLGVADGALAALSLTLIEGCGRADALAAALLIRVATLWIGVGIGAGALLKLSNLLDADIDLSRRAEE